MEKRIFYARCLKEGVVRDLHKVGLIYKVEYFVKENTWYYVSDDRNYSYRTFTTMSDFSNHFEIVYDLSPEQLKEVRKNYQFE